MSDTTHLVNSTQCNTCLVLYWSALPLAGDAQETHFKDMGTEMATQFLGCAPSSAIRPKRR